jgi:hypothetical protein
MWKKLQRFYPIAVVGLVAFSLACASAGNTESSSRRNRNILTQEEMVEASVLTLHEAVQRLRPNWLSTRGGSRSMGLQTGVVVFQGQTMLGEVDILKQFGIDSVVELRYLDGTTASSSLPGLNSRHVTGAIILVANPSRRN